MNASSVILIAFFTSVLSSLGVVFVSVRLDLFRQEESSSAVPSLSGLSVEDARNNLAASGLLMVVGRRRATAEAENDTVLDQVPAPGQKLARGEAVTITLAEALPTVPDLAKRSIAEATVLLEQAGFKIQVGEPLVHETVPAGQIAEQVPPGGQSLEKGRTVTVRPSSGQGLSDVPKLVGTSIASARKALVDAGFKEGKVAWVYDDNLMPFVVIKQTPANGEKAKPGAAIDLVVVRE